MGLFRTQDNTPEVYTAQSRDFQLLGRLYDCIYNGVKFDIDSARNITDSSSCRAELLPLLQTKLGFFSTAKLNDTTLRGILQVFPLLVKHKGSLSAVKQLLNLYLKLILSTGAVDVQVLEKEHKVKVGIETSIQDRILLDEVAKYIVPAGYTIEFYFYTDITANTSVQNMKEVSVAELLTIADGINALVRSSSDTFVNTFENDVVNAVSTTNIASDKNSVISTQYLGMVDELPTTGTVNDIVVVKPAYYKSVSGFIYSWAKVNYRGIYSSTSEVLNPVEDDLVNIYSEGSYTYKVYNGSEWETKTFKGRYYRPLSIPSDTTWVCYAHAAAYRLVSTYPTMNWNIISKEDLKNYGFADVIIPANAEGEVEL